MTNYKKNLPSLIATIKISWKIESEYENVAMQHVIKDHKLIDNFSLTSIVCSHYIELKSIKQIKQIKRGEKH